MNIAPAILREYPNLNPAQKQIIAHLNGPLLVVAGPGSGKTFSLVLRTMNLLLLEKATPRELVIVTFTEKAAFELRDRISAAAQKLGYMRDLSELRVSTIHSFCNRLLTTHRHLTPLGNNYETLDDLTQWLFIFDHFDKIIGESKNGTYLGRWTTRWTAIKGVTEYFNKITEELIDPNDMAHSHDPFLRALAQAYQAYCKTLLANNRLDFAHQQKLVYDLLADEEIADVIRRDIKYVMVDEYQDTNYIQEQLFLKLTAKTRNLCVVGDEDQSLYRFRGATVRNILEFPRHFRDCKIVRLTINYRSHRKIIEAYDKWMASCDWSNDDGIAFRYDKTIVPDPNVHFPNYPAIFCIWGKDVQDEAERFAEMVAFFKRKGVIEDYSQIALLLHSVRLEHSEAYLKALASKGIPAFCPRARAYFDNTEIRWMVACFALIFGWHGAGRGEITGRALTELAKYVDDCIKELGSKFKYPHPLAKVLRHSVRQLENLSEEDQLDMRPADYFYRLLALEPFASFLKDENRARNLAILSQLLNTFQNYYHYVFVTRRNRERLRLQLFNSFFRLLYEGGMNEYEDPAQPFPKGYVQVMTIHQAKGLEFPVVVVGSLDKQLSSPKQIDRDLQAFYHRPPFEPADRITLFDRMRLHYVAFSRPQKVLVLTAHAQPKEHFASIWQGLPQWPYVRKDLLAAQRFELHERMPIKRTYSFTGDLKLYETCPRQYQFFREYNFTPSRSAVIFFGLLVHQTIEDIHRVVLDGRAHTLNRQRIREFFERNFSFLLLTDVRPISEPAKEAAFKQVMNYFNQNQEELKRVIQTEIDVSVEKEGYILTGKVDLLLGNDGKLELLDFKSTPKPSESTELLSDYERQLCIYAHILEKRYGKRPERLLIYWTSEPRKRDALTIFSYRPELVEEAGRHFDAVVRKIQAKEFRVRVPPEKKICQECDIRTLCVAERIISLEG